MIILLSIPINRGFRVDRKTLSLMSEFISLFEIISQQWLTFSLSQNLLKVKLRNKTDLLWMWRKWVWQPSQRSENRQSRSFSVVKFKAGYGPIKTTMNLVIEDRSGKHWVTAGFHTAIWWLSSLFCSETPFKLHSFAYFTGMDAPVKERLPLH